MLPAGHYETPTHSTYAPFMRVWLPLRAPAPPLGVYRESIRMGKKFRVIASSDLASGVPSWFPTACLCPTRWIEIATASPHLGAAGPELVADALRGVVLIAHGHSDGPLALAHVAERLASVGFVVAAPSFSDSHSNDATSIAQFGSSFLPEHTALRVRAMEDCHVSIRDTFGGLQGKPTALIGYSIGTDTVRHMPMECPRLYVGGPGWVNKISAERNIHVPPPPAGPSCQLLAAPDGLMDHYELSADKSSELTGYACPEKRTKVTAEEFMQRVLPLASASSDTQQGSSPPPLPVRHLRIDYEPFGHGDFKYPPFEAAETNAWRSGFCGVNPWDPMGAGPDPAVKQERAAESAEAIVRWLLAATGTATVDDSGLAA